MYRSILLPLDGSEFAEKALPVAAEIARREGARIHAVHVHEPLFGEIDAELQERERAYLEERATRLREELGDEVTTRNLVGRINDQLQAYSQQVDADLVVMTTHGRGGVTRAWLGSTADSMVRQSRVPVLLVRSKAGEAAPTPYRRVVVPLDGSELAEEVLDHAVRVGGPSAEYRLIRIISPDNVSEEDRQRYGYRTGQDGLVEERRRAEEYLGGLAERLKSEGFQATTHVVGSLRPATAVLEFVREQDADLLAMATQGRGGLRRMVLGSVADKVLRGSEISILLYRPKGG